MSNSGARACLTASPAHLSDPPCSWRTDQKERKKFRMVFSRARKIMVDVLLGVQSVELRHPLDQSFSVMSSVFSVRSVMYIPPQDALIFFPNSLPGKIWGSLSVAMILVFPARNIASLWNRKPALQVSIKINWNIVCPWCDWHVTCTISGNNETP